MPNAFSDWRISLGVVLGVLVFSGACIVFKLATTEAWTTINIVTAAALTRAVFDRS